MIRGVGVDIVELERVRLLLERSGMDRAFARLLTAGEQEYCRSQASPYASVAARIAAKEATFKALSGSYEARGIGWREIEVSHDEHRRPHLILHGRAASRAAELGVERLHVSLTHSSHSAVAFVVAE